MFSWQAIAITVFVIDMLMCGFLWARRTTGVGPVGVGLFLMPLLVLLTMPLLIRVAKEKPWDLAGLMALGLALRFFFCFYRFNTAQDGGVYTQHAKQLARHYRHFQFDVDTGGSFPGTGGMRFIAGIVAVITNSNAFAEFLVFTWLAFIGCYLLYRAFVTAMPNGDHHRYALLIFLWPTLLFWPSSLGKDCWMMFTLGVGALGAARVLSRRPGGYTLLVLGLGLGVTMIMLPVGVVIGLLGFAIFVGGLFVRFDSR